MVQWQSLLPSTRLRSIGKNIISRFSSRKLTALSETKTKRHLPDRRQNGFIMFSCTSSKSWWVIARLLVWIFPELPVFNILLASCRRGFLKKKKGKREEKEHTEATIQTIISPNEPIIIILTAIQFFSISVPGGGGGGRNARSLSYPSPLRSACQPASQAEPGRRNSGHNEIDDNKAEDGEMAVTEWDGAQQFAWPEMKRAAFLTSRTSTRNCESKSSLWQLMGFSSFPEAGRCPEQYRAPLSTSFRDNYELNMATYHTGGDGMKIQSVPDTCFLRIIWWK